MAQEAAPGETSGAGSSEAQPAKKRSSGFGAMLSGYAKKAEAAGKKLVEKAQDRASMEGLIGQARISLGVFLNPELKAEQQIPTEILKNAKGIVFLTVVKGGFGVGAAAGSGVLMCKNEAGWSPTVAIACAGVNWGLQIGASKVDYIMVLNDDESVETFQGKGQLKVGADANVSVGPKGRDAGVGVAASSEAKIAPIVSYAMAKGAYAGITLKGEVMAVRKDANTAFYGKEVTAKDILRGMVEMPKNEDYSAIVAILDAYVKGEAYNESVAAPAEQKDGEKPSVVC